MKSLKKHFFALLFILSPCLFSQSISLKECENMIENGVKMMFEKQHIQSLELLIQAASIADENQWHKQKFRALLNTGSNYYLMSDFGEALEYYLGAYEVATMHLEPKDKLTVLNNIGILYFQDENLTKAKEYFSKAYELSFNQKNNSKRGYYAINLALVLNKMNQPDEARNLIQEAIPLVKNQPEIEVMAKMAEAENYFIQKEYNRSKELAQALLPLLKGEAQADNKVFLLLLLSKIHQNNKDYYAALKYAKLARIDSKVLENREDVYDALSKAYSSINDYDKALIYKDSMIFALDTIQKIRNNALYENNKIKFELQNYTHELNESRLLLQKERRFFYTITSGVVLLLILIIWLFRNYLTRQKQKKKIIALELEHEKNKRLVAEKQMREQDAILKLEQEKLKNEIDAKNRKLTSKALYLSSRNELIKEIIQTLSENPQVKSKPNLLIQIKELSKHLKNDPQLESFFRHFEDVNPGFSARLLKLNPKITQQDVRFIIYLRMNLSNNEIASLLNITSQSCRKRKERIRKKLNLPNDTTLASYIANI
ncbi:tetratricopeptide repeat protein [Aequorivita sp. 609]|uniref:tetratricopeptide repeat protein n=1 Tax=Aequorivita TaxID=153265 RepID=UPI00161CECA5|nr:MULTISPECIES: tetratricopeptide repeat protein [Aequorivita]MBB6680487.1 tetratricopeptide repeat protein [Aequorivita sp. 609]